MISLSDLYCRSEGGKLLANLLEMHPRDVGRDIQVSIVADYITLGILVSQSERQQDCEAKLNALEAAVRTGDESARLRARFALKALTERVARDRQGIVDAAHELRSAAETMIACAQEALREEADTTPPPDPAG